MTGWKQYLACFPGPSREVHVQNCTCKAVPTLYEGGNPNPSTQMAEKTDHPSALKEQLWHRSFALSPSAELGKQLWWQLERGQLFSFASGRREESSALVAPRWASCSLMRAEEHPSPFLAFLKKRQLMRMTSEEQRFTGNVPVSLWIGQLWQGTLSEDTFLHNCPSWIVSCHPLQQAHTVYFSCM